MSRFDYVKYDETSIKLQDEMKRRCAELGAAIECDLKSPRAKALAITKLEECFVWIGKAIRDDQIARNGSAELQEERKDG